MTELIGCETKHYFFFYYQEILLRTRSVRSVVPSQIKSIRRSPCSCLSCVPVRPFLPSAHFCPSPQHRFAFGLGPGGVVKKVGQDEDVDYDRLQGVGGEGGGEAGRAQTKEMFSNRRLTSAGEPYLGDVEECVRGTRCSVQAAARRWAGGGGGGGGWGQRQVRQGGGGGG